MNKLAKLAFFGVAAVLVLAAPAFAQGNVQVIERGFIEFSRELGVGLVIIGGAYGIGKLASSALESMARQPEVAGNIQTAMIIAAALIEGATLFALVILGFVRPL